MHDVRNLFEMIVLTAPASAVGVVAALLRGLD
jgi:hypothetical protein